jgi:transketolase
VTDNDVVTTRLAWWADRYARAVPCQEWFDAQPPAYRPQVLSRDVTGRVSIGACAKQGWREIVGEFGEIISIERFGASAEGNVVF